MNSLLTACLVPVLVLFFRATAIAADAAHALMARPGGDAGLVVLVEPDPGPALALSADLARTGRHQILILSTRPDVVEQCTAELSRQGVYPVADARLWLRPERLPFPTNAVNMLLLDKAQSDRLGQDEVMRVLVPGHGFALIGAQEQRKPRPQGMDVWLGMNRDATGNRLSRDLLDPPNSIQWLGGRQGAPARVHIISDRVHFIDANTSNDRYRPQFGRPARDTHARDAFSGVTLWNRHHAMGSYINWSFICFSDGQRLFLPVEGAGRRSRQNAPPQDLLMQSLDLHTGQVLQPELPLIRWNQRLRRQEIQQGDWGINNFFSHRVISDGRRIYHADGGNILRALSPDGTTLLWENTLPDNEFADMVATDGNVLALVIASTDDNPFASMRLFPRHDNIAKAIVGLDPATGRQRWRYDGVNGHALKFLICDFNTVVAASHLNDPRKARETARQSGVPSFQQIDNNILVSLDAATGKQHFRRTGRDGFPDVPQLLGHRASLNLGPDHIIFNEANAAYVFDRLTGKTLHEVTAGQHGYFTRHCATTLRWIIHNNVFASYDGSIADQTAHLVAVEDYSGFSKPANNMFYITPGFRSSSSPKWLGDQTALARETSFPPLWPESDRLLVRGTAHGIAQPQPQDWPTFRADFARRAWRPADGPAGPLQLAWTAQIPIPDTSQTIPYVWAMNSDSPGEITQPVANARYVVVAVPNRREVVCLNLHDGSIRWTRRLAGRVAAPPTLAGDVAFVGVNDATVSAINLNDGRLIWTFFAAPYERLHNAHAQIESTHPVRSSPVLHDGLLYVTAGRHGSVDNGLHVWALDAATGQPKAHRRIDHAHTNDVMQLLVDGTLRLVATELETGTLAVRYRPAAGFGPVPVGRSNQYRGIPAEGSASKAPSINPNARGHDGGHGWIGPIPIWMGVHLTSGAGVYGMHVGPGIRCVTQQNDRFSLYLGQSKRVFEERSIEDHKQILRTFKLPIPMERQAMESCLAGAGRFHYLAARRGNAKIALGVIDPEKQTFDLAEADIASPSEELIPDGIAIAHGYVILTTSLGRVLAFKPAD